MSFPPIFRTDFPLTLVALALLCGCGKAGTPAPGSGPPGGGAKGPVPVAISEVVESSPPLTIETFGSVEAYETVAVKSQVEGQLVTVHVKPGQGVTKGQLLFSIDPRAYEAALKREEAALSKNQVLAMEGERRALLKKKLFERSSISEDEMKTVGSLVDAIRAEENIDRARIDLARLEVEHCSIRSPIDGHLGDILIRQGSIVKANDLPIAVASQISPVYVSFAAPEIYLPSIRKSMARGPLEVGVKIPGDASESQGVVVFVDSTVDTATGTIRLKAEFPNKDKLLWPGQFVEVKLSIPAERVYMAVPAKAVQKGPNGKYVFALEADGAVRMRSVSVERNVGDTALVSGQIAVGERVVTDGHLRLTPGAKAVAKPAVIESSKEQVKR